MKFRKEIIIFSLIIIFMLMSAVSAEENITIDDGTDSTSDYMELDSDQGYNENNISETPILDDDVSDDDENISEGGIEQDTNPNSLDKHDDSVGYGFNGVSKAGISLNKKVAFHKVFSCSHYSKGDSADVGDNECSIDEMLSNFHSPKAMSVEALNDIHTEDLFAETCSSCREYFDYLKIDSLENLIEENKIRDVFNSNINIVDFITVNYLKYDLINFMDAGEKYVDFSIMDLSYLNAFLDIFDKIMNTSSTHNVMANIPSSNYNPMLRNYKYYSNYSDYSFYQDVDYYSCDLNDEMKLFIESDSNISDLLIIHDNMTLINQTFDFNTIPDDVCINSFDMESDLQLSDDAGYWLDPQDNSDKTVAIQSFKFSQQVDCLSSNMSENIQHTFYHMIGCECTNTSFTKPLNSYDNLPKVSEFDTITSSKQEDNHDCVLFKKYNVNSPFIVEDTSIFSLFGVIEITIP